MKFNSLAKFGLCLVLFLSAANVQAAEAVEADATRAFVVKENLNDYSQNAVFVDVDQKDRAYVEDDLLVATVMSDKDGYLYLLHIDAKDKKTVLIPNKFFNDNRIEARTRVSYPNDRSSFCFRVRDPNFGKEKIVAFVTQKPLDSIRPEDFDVGAAKTLDRSTETALVDELEKRRRAVEASGSGSKNADFATHYVEFETKPRQTSTTRMSKTSAKNKTFAVCVGIGKYSSSRIDSIDGCESDAVRMAEVFQKYCGVAAEDCVLICNQSATLNNIRKIFVDVLPNKTSPGDVVYIYWSGHGCSVNGASSLDNQYRSEYLVPYDADVTTSSRKRNTMLHEDAFGAWIRLLSGRKILIFLDACRSGGLIDDTKRQFLFGTKALARSRALGQTDLYVLASSAPDEDSRMCEDGNMSVATYVLVETIENCPISTTHKELFARVKRGVDNYMRNNYPGQIQSIVFADDLSPGLQLKKESVSRR